MIEVQTLFGCKGTGRRLVRFLLGQGPCRCGPGSLEDEDRSAEAVPPIQRAELSRVPEPTIAERIKTVQRQEKNHFYMKAKHTIDKPARAGRATQIAAMVITGLVAFIWVYFGRLYLIRDPDEWRLANQQLGYPLYIIPLIGVTHILGGLGLLVPNVPRLTEWVYAGLGSIFYSRSIHN